MAITLFTLAAVAFVAYANGANDNFKGVSTLFGSGTTDYRRALAWGTVTTFAGSLTALFLSTLLVKAFSGAGLVPDELVGSSRFIIPVALATAGTVLLATLFSFPISTTHALTGALVGAGAVLAAGNLRLGVLGTNFLLPLLLSPVVAIVLTLCVYPVLRWVRVRLGIRRETCVCVSEQWVPVQMANTGEAAAVRSGIQVGVCQDRYQGTIFAVEAQSVLNAVHYLSAGAVSFARGLNDTPKIVALLVAAQATGLSNGLAIVGLAMGLGAALQARRVAETMSRKITPMNHGQGFAANLVTAGLVVLASKYGLPVSTTHVSCGSLFGIGLITREARWKTIASICVAWMSTLPIAALLAAATAVAVRSI